MLSAPFPPLKKVYSCDRSSCSALSIVRLRTVPSLPTSLSSSSSSISNQSLSSPGRDGFPVSKLPFLLESPSGLDGRALLSPSPLFVRKCSTSFVLMLLLSRSGPGSSSSSCAQCGYTRVRVVVVHVCASPLSTVGPNPTQPGGGGFLLPLCNARRPHTFEPGARLMMCQSLSL